MCIRIICTVHQIKKGVVIIKIFVLLHLFIYWICINYIHIFKYQHVYPNCDQCEVCACLDELISFKFCFKYEVPICKLFSRCKSVKRDRFSILYILVQRRFVHINVCYQKLILFFQQFSQFGGSEGFQVELFTMFVYLY